MYLPQQESESIIFKGWFFLKAPCDFWHFGLEWVSGRVNVHLSSCGSFAESSAVPVPSSVWCWSCGAGEQQLPGTAGKEPKHPNWPKATTIQGKKKPRNTLTLKNFKYLKKKKKSAPSFQHRKGSNLVSTFRILGIPFMFLILVMTDLVQHQGVKANSGTAHGHLWEVRF